MGAHARADPVIDRADLDVDGLQAAEGALDTGEALVGQHGPLAVERYGRQARAQNVDAVERGLGRDGGRLALEVEVLVGDGDLEGLGDLALVDHGADSQADLAGAAERAPGAPGPGP